MLTARDTNDTEMRREEQDGMKCGGKMMLIQHLFNFLTLIITFSHPLMLSGMCRPRSRDCCFNLLSFSLCTSPEETQRVFMSSSNLMTLLWEQAYMNDSVNPSDLLKALEKLRAVDGKKWASLNLIHLLRNKCMSGALVMKPTCFWWPVVLMLVYTLKHNIILGVCSNRNLQLCLVIQLACYKQFFYLRYWGLIA